MLYCLRAYSHTIAPCTRVLAVHTQVVLRVDCLLDRVGVAHHKVLSGQCARLRATTSGAEAKLGRHQYYHDYVPDYARRLAAQMGCQGQALYYFGNENCGVCDDLAARLGAGNTS